MPWGCRKQSGVDSKGEKTEYVKYKKTTGKTVSHHKSLDSCKAAIRATEHGYNESFEFRLNEALGIGEAPLEPPKKLPKCSKCNDRAATFGKLCQKCHRIRRRKNLKKGYRE